jgi:sulfite exporter TauE/SafE
MSKRHATILMVLVPCALFWSFAALVGRADSPEQVNTGKVVDWIILGPLWAGITYIVASAVMRTHPKRLSTALVAAHIVWVAVALAANWWEDEKMEIRERAFRHMQDGGSVSNNAKPDMR